MLRVALRFAVLLPRLCCTVPAFGQVVVATGTMVPEADPGLVLRGSRWALAGATLRSVE